MLCVCLVEYLIVKVRKGVRVFIIFCFMWFSEIFSVVLKFGFSFGLVKFLLGNCFLCSCMYKLSVVVIVLDNN